MRWSKSRGVRMRNSDGVGLTFRGGLSGPQQVRGVLRNAVECGVNLSKGTIRVLRAPGSTRSVDLEVKASPTVDHLAMVVWRGGAGGYQRHSRTAILPPW